MNRSTDDTPDSPPVSTPTDALEMFVTLQDKSLTRAEREAFADWLCRSPVHVEEFLQLTALRGELARLPEIQQADVEQLMREAGETSNVVELAALTSHGRGAPLEAADVASSTSAASATPAGLTLRSALRPLLAAMLLVVIGIATVGPLRSFLKSDTDRFETAVGEQRSLTLSDGSHVQINVRSNLSARMSEAGRDIQLDRGEVLFKVAKDATRPFLVHTPQAVIRAVGTEFNVRVRGATTIVSLLEGHVEVRRPGSAEVVRLEPGQAIAIEPQAGLSQPHPADLAAATAWTQRRLVFDDAPLSEVIGEFNRYSRQAIVIEDAALAKLRITASFDSENAQTFLDTLASARRLRLTRAADGTLIISRQDEEPSETSAAEEI